MVHDEHVVHPQLAAVVAPHAELVSAARRSAVREVKCPCPSGRELVDDARCDVRVRVEVHDLRVLVPGEIFFVGFSVIQMIDTEILLIGNPLIQKIHSHVDFQDVFRIH